MFERSLHIAICSTLTFFRCTHTHKQYTYTHTHMYTCTQCNRCTDLNERAHRYIHTASWDVREVAFVRSQRPLRWFPFEAFFLLCVALDSLECLVHTHTRIGKLTVTERKLNPSRRVFTTYWVPFLNAGRSARLHCTLHPTGRTNTLPCRRTTYTNTYVIVFSLHWYVPFSMTTDAQLQLIWIHQQCY